ncbi:hypothetical protein ASF43_07180 [Pseudorhodoferax sp. Leaf267]|nr:hypothetical protein ASF43_07180 [Pseudorhodoferax sp. Leaf267]
MRSHLSALLLVSMLLMLCVVGSTVLAYRIPRIEREAQASLQREVAETGARVELLLSAQQERLALLAALLDTTPASRADAVLDKAVRHGDPMRAVYWVSPQGRIVAAGLPDGGPARRASLLGSDLSANGLFRAASAGAGAAWSGRYQSVLAGDVLAGVARRDRRGGVLIAEVPLDLLLQTVEVAAGAGAASVWVVDRNGEIIADTDDGRDVGKFNIRSWPLMQALLRGREIDGRQHFQGADFRVASVHSAALDWYFVGHVPLGLANPEVRGMVLAVLASIAGCLAIGLLIAPAWARTMARPLQGIVARAAQTMGGAASVQAWPRGRVAEFNHLSDKLTEMAQALHEREQRFSDIFNASPVPMAVSDLRNASRLLYANDAWCSTLMHRREDALGRTGLELGLFSEAQRDALRRQAQHGDMKIEFAMRRGDGALLQTQTFGRRVAVGGEDWLIWANVDIGPLRRVEQAQRELNQQLEARVRQRTDALAAAHDALSATVAQLRAAQDELVRSEKMAALGQLVAGVAHELNTPLGNGVMAVSAMADATRRFQSAMQAGLKRTDLRALVDGVQQGVDIAGRNLHRAADLVHSFKQVAVDQTSAQRRRFALGEVVHEMVVSLQPSFARKPWRIDVDVPATGLQMDSYPGALGQAVGNLIQNAVLHGFDGRAHGTVRITAGPAQEGWVWLRVADDGRGIAAEHIGRIFEPFMTTRMGRGGTGLGLHISYNAVVDLLGGTLTVHSTEGQGATFEMRLPRLAPLTAPAVAPGAA